MCVCVKVEIGAEPQSISVPVVFWKHTPCPATVAPLTTGMGVVVPLIWNAKPGAGAVPKLETDRVAPLLVVVPRHARVKPAAVDWSLCTQMPSAPVPLITPKVVG